MAQVKFYRGLAEKYVAANYANCIYFATDTKELMLDGKAYGVSTKDATLLSNAVTGVQWTTPDTLTFTRGEGKEYLNVTFPLATKDNQGLMSSLQVEKLQGIEEGAQVNIIEDVVVDGVTGTVENKTLTINGGFAKAANVYTKDQVYTKEEIADEFAAKLASVYEYKGSVSTYAELPGNAEKGDVYNVETEHELHPGGTNWAWNGSEWDALGGLVDLTDIRDNISTNANAIITNANAISDEQERAEGVEQALRRDLGQSTAAAGDDSAFARIKQLEDDINSLTGGSGSVATQIQTAIDNLKAGASTDYDTLKDLEDAIKGEVDRATQAELAIANSVTAEKERAEEKEAELQAAINKLNGADTAEGSVKKQIKDAIGALDATVGSKTVAEGKHVAVEVVETDGVLTGITVTEADIASESAVNQAISDEASTRAAQDDKIEAAVGLNADGSHKESNGNYTKGAATIAEEISMLDAQLKTSVDEISRVEGLVTAEANTRSEEDSKLSNRITKLEDYFAEGDGEGTVADQIKDAVDTLEAKVNDYTVNGIKISTNPVLTGDNVLLTSYSPVTGGFIAATDTVNAAISKLENDLIWHEA